MDTLILRRRGQEVRRFPLGDEIVEVGRAPEADLCVDDAALPERAFLVHATRGSVYVYTLSERPLRARLLPHEGELALGREHTLHRARGPASPAPAERTTRDVPRLEPITRWTLLVGRGPEARRLSVEAEPVRIGSAPDNDLVLADPTVSAHHCRLEPTGRDLVVRDLASLNGTWLDGVRAERARIHGGARLQLGNTHLRVLGALEDRPNGRTFVAASAAMQSLTADIERFATLPWPTLVLGPSGAGKEEVAARLHRLTRRNRGPFVALNAGGLPPNLIESELFGHERGAFTGAAQQHRGVFEQASSGTLFLDEIGELPMALQARLLRVLETWTIRRVGSERDTPVDVHLVCATHRDLAAMVTQGQFREDLYYRLNRLVLRVPSLAERPEDILPLADHFLAQVRDELGHRELSRQARARLLAHDYPGNVRELRNVVCAAAAMAATPRLETADLEAAFERLGGSPRPATASGDARPRLERAVAEYGGNLSAAARALGLPRSTLRDRLRSG